MIVFGYEISVYIFWLVGAIISALIYAVIPEEKKHELNLILRNFGDFFIIILFWLFFLSTDLLGEFEKNSVLNQVANFLFVIFILIDFSIRGFLYYDRYKYIHAIANNRSGSCASYVQRGEYIILKIGGTDLIDVGQESWIIPARHFSKIDGKTNSMKTQIVIQSIIEKTSIEFIPTHAKIFFEEEADSTWNQENIFYGEISTEELLQDSFKDGKGNKISASEFTIGKKNENYLMNHTQDLLHGKMKQLQDVASKQDSIRKKIEGKSALPQDIPRE